MTDTKKIDFQTDPARYRHWRIETDGPVASLVMDVDETGGLFDGYELKLNSYDLGVDIELADAVQRLRFEHPEVRAVVIRSGKERVFCAGANIRMLAGASHAHKVNFCKFTNETRNGIEDASENSGQRYIAAVKGACAGGGYELALATDHIMLTDDGSSTVALPEVPLLAVLPGTGGLTRVTDKRKVRRDLADVFCTTSEGVRADRAKDWKLIDDYAPPAQFDEFVQARAAELAAGSDRTGEGEGVKLPELERNFDDAGYHYKFVDVALNYDDRTATITLKTPEAGEPTDPAEIRKAGADWWGLRLTRELDDAILMLRTNNGEIGTWILKTEGDADAVLAQGKVLAENQDDWFIRETTNFLRRTLARLDVSSRSMFALIDAGSCFAGVFAELFLAADRSYMLDDQETPENSPVLIFDDTNFGMFEMPNGISRIAAHFQEDEAAVAAVEAKKGEKIDPAGATDLGLVTFAPDDLDWDDEVRIAIEERTSLSPDALTGMEASLRFGGRETMATKVFGRLSAWQNWIFIRPNAVGEKGALKLYGTGTKPNFNWERV